MTVRERFDRVTAQIESKIKENKSAPEIAEKVAKENAISERDLSTVILFFSGKTLYQYIDERIMNASCECLLNSDKKTKESIQDAIRISGVSDQPTFCKKFKKTFGMTPTEVCAKKDYSILSARLTWVGSSNIEVKERTKESNVCDLSNDTVFGLARYKYEEVKEAIELQELYGFDELQSGIAYDIHQTYKLPLKETFRFVDEYEYKEYTKEDAEKDEQELKDFFGLPEDYQFAPEEEDVPHLTREEYYDERVRRDADDPEIRFAFFEVGVSSIYAIYHLIDKLHALGDNNIAKLDPELIKMCAYDDFDARYCKKAVAYYLENATDEFGDDAFEEYVGYLLNGQYIEDAFDNIWHTEGWDDYETDCPYHSMEELNRELQEYDPDDPFEKWAAEETDYSDKYNAESIADDDE